MAKTTIKNFTRLSFVIFGAVLFALATFYLPVGEASANHEIEPGQTPIESLSEKAKYSSFPHSAKAHRLECGSCHKFPTANWNKVRTGTSAFPDQTDYPKHDSCVRCHTQQFFKGPRPAVCSICHTNPSPRDSSRHPFPNPREIFDLSPKGKTATSDFAVTFPHDKHIEIVSSYRRGDVTFGNASFARGDRGRRAEESCSVCHKTMQPQDKSNDEFLVKPPAKIGDAFWLKKGTFKSAPLGHTTCFTCHSADTGILPAPQTCSACHTLKTPASKSDFDAKLAAPMVNGDKVMTDAWRLRTSAGAFRHEHFAHNDLSCSTCHNVMTLKTAEPLTKKVPLSSCATCHATATSDDGGALNYEMDQRKANAAFQCVKCHITYGKLAIPDSHTKAIAAAATVK